MSSAVSSVRGAFITKLVCAAAGNGQNLLRRRRQRGKLPRKLEVTPSALLETGPFALASPYHYSQTTCHKQNISPTVRRFCRVSKETDSAEHDVIAKPVSKIYLMVAFDRSQCTRPSPKSAAATFSFVARNSRLLRILPVLFHHDSVYEILQDSDRLSLCN